MIETSVGKMRHAIGRTKTVLLKITTMTITTYGNIGKFLFWTGVVTVVASIAFFLFACRGISIGDPDGLHLHDTYYVLFSLGHRLVLLLPLIAGLLLVLSGLLIRSQVLAIGSEFQRDGTSFALAEEKEP